MKGVKESLLFFNHLFKQIYFFSIGGMGWGYGGRSPHRRGVGGRANGEGVSRCRRGWGGSTSGKKVKKIGLNRDKKKGVPL